MATDIVTQLKELAPSLDRGEGRSTVYGAASEIEHLRKVIEELRAEVSRLSQIAKY